MAEDTWEAFSDRNLLPDAVYYGKRLISLQRIWELAHEHDEATLEKGQLV